MVHCREITDGRVDEDWSVHIHNRFNCQPQTEREATALPPIHVSTDMFTADSKSAFALASCVHVLETKLVPCSGSNFPLRAISLSLRGLSEGDSSWLICLTSYAPVNVHSAFPGLSVRADDQTDTIIMSEGSEQHVWPSLCIHLSLSSFLPALCLYLVDLCAHTHMHTVKRSGQMNYSVTPEKPQTAARAQLNKSQTQTQWGEI